MTAHRNTKRAVRARMAQTGEKYTQARRALVSDGGGDDAGAPGVTQAADPAPQPLPWFTDQAYNVIVLAQDEARMLGQPQVAPEHVLLAAARSGRAKELLAGAGVSAGAIHAALVTRGGFATNLVVGPIAHSRACEAALWQAIRCAHERGIHGPSSQHLLLGLEKGGAGTAIAILRDLGIVDVAALVDARYPATRGPLPISVPGHAGSAFTRRAPSPGPRPPVFERFTAQARSAIAGAMRSAGELVEVGYPKVEPAHILLGLLGAEEGVVATLSARHQGWFDAAAGRASELLHDVARQARDRVPERAIARVPVAAPAAPSQSNWPPIFMGLELPGDTSVPPSARTNSTMFAPAARHLVSEDVLAVAHRLGHVQLGTGHLLLAVLESGDETVRAILQALPDLTQLAADVTEALPGEERT